MTRKDRARAEHEAWLEERGLTRKQIAQKRIDPAKLREPPPYRRDPVLPPVSHGVGNGPARGMMVNLHEEPEHVREEVMRKARRVETAYSKGPLQYITPGTDLTMIGSRSRRG